MKVAPRILPIIVLAQFCCTSLWFASNGILEDIRGVFNLPSEATAHLTSAVQIGFIVGTLLFAFLSLADRFSSSKVFFISALLGAFANLGMLWEGNTMNSLLFMRALTGFFLAGIYPVGMKIAADHFKSGLGKSLGYLVGALVLGTALPHLLHLISFNSSWQSVIITTSGLAIFGGTILLLAVPDGPYQSQMQAWNPNTFIKVFKNKKFRRAALGYFGHMWELYAFWVFVPWLLAAYNDLHIESNLNTSFWSFVIIGVGGIGCVLSGYISERISVRKTALSALTISGLLCLLSPLIFYTPAALFLASLMLWGIFVVSDSPMFSTLVASEVSPNLKATALTIVNCIGFSITILSVQLISFLSITIDPTYVFVVLGIGPLIGLFSNIKQSSSTNI